MKDMGIKKKESMPEVAMNAKSKISYPSMTISSKVLPEVKDLKMGDTCKMECVYKVKGLRESYDDKTEIICEMDMTKCVVIDGEADYKESKRLGLSRKEYDDLQTKKVKKNA